jgi:hypothetical protein
MAVSTTFEIPDDQREYVEQLAAENRAPLAWALRKCIDHSKELTAHVLNGRDNHHDGRNVSGANNSIRRSSSTASESR